jgi:hypothetical protein
MNVGYETNKEMVIWQTVKTVHQKETAVKKMNAWLKIIH